MNHFIHAAEKTRGGLDDIWFLGDLFGHADESTGEDDLMQPVLDSLQVLEKHMGLAVQGNWEFWLTHPEPDENNKYHRGPYYLMFVIFGFVLIFYGYLYYLINKLRNPSLRYFPVIGFLTPILLGNAIQMQIYGISLLPISFTVAFAAISIALQNECIYIDKLTGVYNRYELDKVLKGGIIRRNMRIAALMLDLNDFKSINDNFSHEEGDNALVAFASILSETVSSEGIIIRFAGDEFIILMPKFKGSDISVYKDRINANLEKYNETSGKPYKLAAAIGGRIFDSRQDDMSDLVSQIDSLMYSDKKAYYMDHDRRGKKQHSKKAAE